MSTSRKSYKVVSSKIIEQIDNSGGFTAFVKKVRGPEERFQDAVTKVGKAAFGNDGRGIYYKAKQAPGEICTALDQTYENMRGSCTL